MEGLKIIGRKNGAGSWTMTAQKAVFDNASSVLMESIEINVPETDISLNADKGAFNPITNDLYLNDNIRVRSKGSFIYLKSLLWNPSSETIASPDNIRIKGHKYSIEGSGLTAGDRHKIRLMKNVKATFY